MSKFMIDEALRLCEESWSLYKEIEKQYNSYCAPDLNDGCFEDWSHRTDWFNRYDDVCAFQRQYEAAIQRTSEWWNDHLGDHLLGDNGALVHRHKSSFVAGFKLEGAFVLSHFAPYSLREGMEHLKVLNELPFKVLVSVPHYQAQMLMRLGFKWVGITYQFFGGEFCRKLVLVNSSWGKSDIKSLQCKLKAGLSEFFEERPTYWKYADFQ